MNRRELLKLSVMGAAATAAAPTGSGTRALSAEPFEHAGKSIKQLQGAMKDGALTSAALCNAYLKRIEQLNGSLRAVLEVNPEALPLAEALDKERKDKGARGLLHGIPVLLKDNLDTGDKQQTTAGSLALVGTPAKNDAFVVKKLREAGAVVLGKANLSEWANIRSSRGTSGWSARGGQGRNPYALDRSPIGSSSGCGIAVAADLCTVAVGTETDGSIISPASAMGIVGLKPTVGLLSRSGVIPISHTQDTPGPMARSVEDLTVLLGAMTAFDGEDMAMRVPGRKTPDDYLKGLNEKDALKGKRLGVARGLFGKGPKVQKAMAAALKDLENLGATLIDVELAPLDSDAELEVMLFELKADLEEYLKKRRPDAAVKNLADLIAFNVQNAEREMPFFAQELFVKAQAKGPLTSPAYRKALDTCHKKVHAALDPTFVKNKLDAFVTGAMDPAWLIDPVLGDTGTAFGGSYAATAGYPSLTVPMGEVGGLPIGLLFFGISWSEPQLLKFAYAFEAVTQHRKPPTFAATATPKF